MRIGLNLHCFDDRISGVDYYALGLLRALLRIAPQNDYTLFTNRPDLVLAHVPASERLHVVEVGHVRNRIARVLFEHLELPGWAERRRLDVLHCTNYVAPLRGTSVPYVVTVHDTIAMDHPRWCKRANALYHGLALVPSARRAHRIITVSGRTAADLGRRLGRARSRIRVIYPGIDGIFRPDGDRASQEHVRARYGLPDRYILWVGNIEPKKNVGALLRLQRRLKQERVPHQLVVVGGRSWRAGTVLRDLRGESAAGNVVVTGYVERRDLPCIYQMADLFVFPSLYEGFGFPPLEAMACGAPVVSSGEGALRETLGSAAWLVDPCDDEKILDAVRVMLLQPDVRDRYAQAGLLRSRRFQWDRAAEATVSVYAEVAGARDHRTRRRVGRDGMARMACPDTGGQSDAVLAVP